MLKILISIFLLSPAFCFSQEEDTTGSNISNKDAKEILDHHNNARSELKIPPLKWSAELAAFAQDWADSLASADECKLRHRQNNKYGENIFASSASPEFKPVSASQSWYAEKAKYKYSRVGEDNWKGAGHYTAMIWKNTTEVGVGMATCANGNIIIVANYNPAGNMSGDYPY